jgi:PPM family protein phosphatase
MNENRRSGPTDNLPPLGPAKLPTPFSSLIDVDVFALSHKGHVRSRNEDHYLVVRGGRAFETVLSSLSESSPGDLYEETAYAMIVADGIGGEAGGEIASRQAIYTLLSLGLHTPDWQFRWGLREENTVKWRMVDRFRRINAALLQQAISQPKLAGMGTTMTVALTYANSVIVTHIGDSRAYLLHDGKLERLTRDHTLAERLLLDEIYAPNDQLLNELRNVLLQVLGSDENACNPDVQHFPLADKDQLLLCTDGLTDMVEETLIKEVLNREDSPRSACRTLIDLALSNGGNDNVTVVVARYSIPG